MPGAGVVVLSPHLDDAVFGCGALLAGHPGSTVLTVFAGVPPEAADRCTAWDARCGFADARTAMAARRAEDERALALLEARPVRLDFGDAQYGRTPSIADVAAALRERLAQIDPGEAVLLPLGLFHSDHLLVHAAGLRALSTLAASSPTLLYEDALYRGMSGVLQQRLACLLQAGRRLTPAAWPAADARCAALKAEAVRCYASQLRAFGAGGHDDLARAERCWRLDLGGDGA